MVNQPEKRMLWHPRGASRFAVGAGSQLTLYEYTPHEPAIKDVASLQDLSLMKCFAWSPADLASDLFAVGLSTGRIDLVRLSSDAATYAPPRSAPSNAQMRPLSHLPNRPQSVSLTPRTSRPTTALAFSPTAPQYLAQGLDKSRSDASLLIWDVNASAPALALTQLTAPPPSPSVPLAPLPSTPITPSYTLPRIDAVSSARGADSHVRPLQTHAPAEATHALAWLEHTHYLLAAAQAQRILKLFDLRSQGSGVVFGSGGTAAAGRANVLASSEHWLAASGDGGTTLWDTRRAAAPLLTFSARDAWADGNALGGGDGTVVETEWSRVRRGVFATLERGASVVRFWDVLRVDGGAGGGKADEHAPNGTVDAAAVCRESRGKLSWTPWGGASGGGSGGQSPAMSAPKSVAATEGDGHHVILSDTRQSIPTPHPLASFAIIPPSQSSTTHVPLTTSILALTTASTIHTSQIHDTPIHTSWSSRGGVVLGLGTEYRWFTASSAAPEPDEDAGAPHPQDAREPEPPNTNTSIDRGRPAPRFGRGDEDGFPALVVQPPRPSPSPRTRSLLLPSTQARAQSLHRDALRQGSASPSPSPSPYLKAQLELPHGASPLRVETRTSVSLSAERGEREKERARSVKEGGGAAREARARSKSRRRRPTAVERVQALVEEDMSMVMRRRAARGYGLANSQRNATILSEEGRDDKDGDRTLSFLWAWIHEARELLSGSGPAPDSVFNHHDFTGKGLLGIWQGFPSALSAVASPAMYTRLFDPADSAPTRSRSRRGRPRPDPFAEFGAAVMALCAARGIELGNEKEKEKGAWRPAVPTNRLVQRRFALLLCGWNLKEDELQKTIARWEKGGKVSQAACWLVFVGRHGKAIDLLMRSQDESHPLMSGTIAALMPTGAGAEKPPELREHCERLIVRLQDAHFRAMLTYLALGDFTEVLEEEALPLSERLAIALQFLEDDALSAYLRRVADRATTHGDVEGLVLTGLTPAGVEILQSYVDRTGDLQSAAILGTLCTLGKKDGRVVRWVDGYRDLLDSWKMFDQRCQFDIERGTLGRLYGEGEVVRKQLAIRCNYCNKVISPPPASSSANRATACPFCNRSMPRCSICLMSLSIVPDLVRDNQLAHPNARSHDTIDDAIVFCQTCRHGGHAAHILEWFYGNGSARSRGVCAIASCNCRCVEES